MKVSLKWFLVIISMVSLRADHSIVLVHIGDSIPSYLTTCVQQIRLFNDCDVYLIANKKALDGYKITLNHYQVVGVALECLNRSLPHKVFIKNMNLSHGFWQYATERFFYLDELVQERNLKNVFHLEYDNMLYVDLATVVPIFQNYYRSIAATFDNDQRCIPGFVFIKNRKAISDLVVFMARISSQGKNDMESIGLYRSVCAYGIDSLPIIMPEYRESYRLRSASSHEVKDESIFCNNIASFDSIFDAAALGQYLGGIDARAGTSKPGFINESCIFNPSHLEYVWQKDQQGRNIPYVAYGEKWYRVNNLHIHSKKLEKFMS